MTPTVTYTGEEVALVAGFIAAALPTLNQDDFEIADLLLDRALAVMPRPLAVDLATRIEQLRQRSNFNMEDTTRDL
jgi:hypothetical protein